MKNFSPIGHTPAGVKSGKSFAENFEKHFHIPNRLQNASAELVDSVNDWHFAMLNDVTRNEFYFKMLQHYIVPGQTKVAEIGAGSGILSLMAASLGAKSVIAIEGSRELCRLAQSNIEKNNLSSKVKVVNAMSIDVRTEDYPEYLPADILVSEIFGTLLLGESSLDYINDFLVRGLLKKPIVLPRYGSQYAVLIECPKLRSLTSVNSYQGMDLSMMNQLRDTASVVFTKQYGFRLNSVPFKALASPLKVFDLDFTKEKPGFLPLIQKRDLLITSDGTCDALVLFWSAYDYLDGKEICMSTSPSETSDNFCRDMQWGQAIQLVEFENSSTKLCNEDSREENYVNSGDRIEVMQRASQDSVLLQFGFRRIE
ncbi:arginine N-methyltransferase type III [Perkinsela sp. CCAP 1560/4]|nr:arginine N-methyltransferase type III [Perkinsela sp. CCAP 1560/4]|eukprot:KNH09452.1 arginine N-methyltransferase type III [Perkinsela sp. CCAP 1560/4]